jgi:WhiB family redox-sensing transcriptional regulator
MTFVTAQLQSSGITIDLGEREQNMGTEWMAEGKCRDLPPDVFFPSEGLGVQAAQRICAECPVIDQCLEYALAQRIDHGVWGGCSERERRRILRRRRVAAGASDSVSVSA